MKVQASVKKICRNCKIVRRKGVLYRSAPYTHRYPVCWRCQSELVFRLVDEWFISMGDLYDKPRDEVTAEVIDGIPFVRLEHVVRYKESADRPKDRVHLERLSEHRLGRDHIDEGA